MSAQQVKAKHLAIFVDGQNFLSTLRDLFKPNFHRKHHLPPNADWYHFFACISQLVNAQTLQIYWYTIKELDFLPHLDWYHASNSQCERVFRKHSPFLNAEFQNLNTKQKKLRTRQLREICLENQIEMQRRLKEWHQIQDKMKQACPQNVFIRRTGWCTGSA